ncbi:DUF6384 family protein [Pelagibacterium luteolum]|uniref:Uncharacterized protein n=1 Tax=Pelagibacterium luteolum TaxID=440168 RepID=A0A1G7VLP1_9HYPH|nr:DUF6384 family protein [Pelagibacterium luteolum]SDG60488.1 hypothetical protein SAMN04487974_104203 [Pelagibacterium luteolum]
MANTGSMTAEAQKAPLDDVMLAMDVVDTLRHEDNLVAREMSASDREAQLIDRLRKIYHDQGIEVPDRILKEGVKALDESRFTYTPPVDTFQTRLARLYVRRGRWGRPVAIGLALVVLVIGGYFLGYRPYQAGVAEAARIELAETMPAQMDALYRQIFNETKVQSASDDAAELVSRGKAAAERGDREEAAGIIAQLETIRDTLLAEYSIRIVNRPGESTGVWRFPEANTDATNYYLVVEAVGPNGQLVNLPITNEETGQTEEVSTWGIRVPEVTYEAVRVDRQDDGIIQRNILGIKQYGFLETDFTMPVLEGAITQW